MLVVGDSGCDTREGELEVGIVNRSASDTAEALSRSVNRRAAQMFMVDAMRDSATMTSTSEEIQTRRPDTTGPGSSKRG